MQWSAGNAYPVSILPVPHPLKERLGQERTGRQRDEGKHVQHSRANSTPAKSRPSATHAAMQFSTELSYWSTIPGTDRILWLLLSESLLPGLRNTHPSSVTSLLKKKKQKRRCLRVASPGSPPAHNWNDARLRWDWSTTIIKIKTTTAATVLNRTADASGLAIVRRSSR